MCYLSSEKTHCWIAKQQGEKATCECGGPLSMNDKFCGSCGNPNPMLAVENDGETANCISCDEHIDKNSTYCPVCGIKQSGEWIRCIVARAESNMVKK